MGIQSPLNIGRYLGLPSLIGRSKKEVFVYIKDRLWKKLQSWKHRKLSKAGKEVLIKAAAQAIPTYCMTTFLLPSTLLDEFHIMLNKFWWGGNSDESKGINWMRWEKLCVRKDARERGFRDLHLFNIALLGKMGWRLINEPDALVCKDLKARYFPRVGFLDAPLGNNPSYTWRSIFASQDLLRGGVRWKVGDGRTVSVWGQPWLHDSEDFYVRSICPSGFEDMRVHELMVENKREWDVEQLTALVEPEDVRRILDTPLPPIGVPDGVVWQYNKQGNYTVKTEYTRAASLVFDRTLEVEGRWKLLWGLKVPPKVRDCLWRLARDCLPHKVNLFSKKVVEDKYCVFCENQLEDTWHVFFNCTYALECWNVAGLRTKLEAVIAHMDSLLDVIFEMLGDEERHIAAKFGMILWQIWKERNSLVWDNRCRVASDAVYTAANLLLEWTEASLETLHGHAGSRIQTRNCLAWHSPPVGYIKLNTDAAFFDTQRKTGVGLVARDSSGAFLGAKTRWRPGKLEVDTGEAWGFMEAIMWAKELGFEKVIVEGDSQVVVRAMNEGGSHNTVFGDYIRICKDLIRDLVHFSIVFVKREANRLAHELARSSIDYEDAHCWNDPPLFVIGLSNTLCSCNNLS